MVAWLTIWVDMVGWAGAPVSRPEGNLSSHGTRVGRLHWRDRLLLQPAVRSALAIIIALIGASGARAQTGPPSGGVPVPAQQKPAVPQPPPAAAPVQTAPAVIARPDAPPVPGAEE